jgi:thiamine pyrophosphate-dependent acetolactate synthase large subunit-like protein
MVDNKPSIHLDRREVVKTLLEMRGDALVLAGLGSPSYDVMAAGDHDNNYYLWAAMGSAATMGLGIANTQPHRKVIVVTGDGEMLMGMGALATIGIQHPTNLSVIVLDNGHYGETGMQVSHAGEGVALHKIAKACGFDWAERVEHMKGVQELRKRIFTLDSLNFAAIKIDAENKPRVLPPRDGVYIKNRFRAALGFKPN